MMETRTTRWIDENESLDWKRWVAVDDLIEELKKKGITKYHILGELLSKEERGDK